MITLSVPESVLSAWEKIKYMLVIGLIYSGDITIIQNKTLENQDGGIGRHTAPPRTTRIDRESNSKGDQHQGNRK